MATITKKQVDSANSKLSNGFTFDIGYYLLHGEKTAVKRIPLEGNASACLTLMYMDEYENKLTFAGQIAHEKGRPIEECNSYQVPTGRVIPCVHVSKEFDEGAFRTSYGLGKWVAIGPAQDKKLFSTIQKLSAKVNDAYFVAIAKGEPNTAEESKPLFG